MKTYLLALLMLLGANVVFAQSATETQNATEPEVVQFNWNDTTRTAYNFGDIKYEHHGTVIFQVQNSGTDPVVISSAKGSCGCTVPTWSNAPILPGASSEVKVKYDTKRVGGFSKTVTLTLSVPGKDSIVKKLFISGTVANKE